MSKSRSRTNSSNRNTCRNRSNKYNSKSNKSNNNIEIGEERAGMFHLLWEIGRSKRRTEKALSTRTKTSIQPTSAIAGSTPAVGKNVDGYKRGRPLPVIPRIRSRLPRRTKGVPRVGVPCLPPGTKGLP